MIQRGSITVAMTLAVIIMALPTPSPADTELDALLNAQRLRAQRRVYSEQAVLDRSQEQVIDTGPTREEMEIDAQFRAAEAQRDARVADRPATPPPPRPTPPTLRRTDTARNWLTPAMLDEAAGLTQQEDPGEDPFAFPNPRSRERDQGLPTRFDPTEPVFQRMDQQLDSSPFARERDRHQADLRTHAPTHSVDTSPPATRFGVPLTPSQRAEAESPVSPFAPSTLRPTVDPGVSPFSPQAVRSAAQQPTRTRSFGVPSASSSSPFSPDSTRSETGTGSDASQRPIDVLRRSTPIHQADPFNPDRPARPYRGLWE